MSCCSSASPEERAAKEASKEIERSLQADGRVMQEEIKLLLLGTGQSGKSTILKQMKIIFMNGFSDSEREDQKMNVYSNIVQNMQTILKACERFNIEYDSALSGGAQDIMDMEAWPLSELENSTVETIRALWEDAGIQECYERKSEFQLNDTADYFFKQLDRFVDPSWLPDNDDLLHVRQRTTGIVETCFELDGYKFRVMDVGGQRNQRSKWIHCFEAVTAVLFVVGISEYDQVLFEDPDTNRMHESLELFAEICNCIWFQQSSMILFMNKKDLFEQKIEHVSLKTCFPDYPGKDNYDEASQYILKEFEAKNTTDKSLFSHFTHATDTKSTQLVLSAVKQSILSRTMEEAGFA